MIELYDNLTGAIFSDDREYRYALWRKWNGDLKPLLFIGLNPSTANNITNDPTITRCMSRAYQEGFGGLLMGNLFARVSSHPDVLLRDGAIGDRTDEYLQTMIDIAGRVLCAWGSFKEAKKRSEYVLDMIPEPYCLGMNSDGQPKHPLYIPYSVKMRKISPLTPEVKE